jgi:hypothetical protein
VAWANDVTRALRRVDGDLDRARSIRGGDAGRDTLTRLDRDGERCPVGGLVPVPHGREIEFVAALGREAEADQPTPFLGHEVDRLGRCELPSHDEVALVLSVCRVDDDDQSAVPDVLDRLLDRRERGAVLDLQRCFARHCRRIVPCVSRENSDRRAGARRTSRGRRPRDSRHRRPRASRASLPRGCAG